MWFVQAVLGFLKLDKVLALKCNRNNRNSVVLFVGADQLFVLQYANAFSKLFSM